MQNIEFSTLIILDSIPKSDYYKAMKYIGVKEASKKWDISDRRVRLMCSEGRIEGAVKLEWSWVIPENTAKPTDGRTTRHMKNRYLRLGNIDLEKIDKCKTEYPFSPSVYNTTYGQLLIYNNLLYALKEESLPLNKEAILEVLDGKLTQKLKFEELLFISNVKASYLRTNELFREFTDYTFKELLQIVFQGTTYDKDYNEEIKLQMEVLFSQYEVEWKVLNPLYKALLVFTELERIKPLKKYNTVISLLVLNGILTTSGFYPISFDETMNSEINATLTLVKRRGNYQDFALIVERCLLTSYNEISYV